MNTKSKTYIAVPAEILGNYSPVSAGRTPFEVDGVGFSKCSTNRVDVF